MFGAVNSATRQETTQGVKRNQGVYKGGMKSLEGSFDNLASVGVDEKSVLEQMVANNTKLAATNMNLVTIVKKLTDGIKYLERENSRLKKDGQGK